MRVLQINAINKYKSTGRTTFEAHREFQRMGIDSFVAAPQNTEGCKEFYQIGNRLDWKIHALGSRVFGMQGYFSHVATWKLLKYIDLIKPDVIHIRNLHGNYINLPMLFCYIRKHNIPIVVNLHDCWFYTGKCTHYTIQECYKWERGCFDCPRLKNDNISWFFDKTSKMWHDKEKWFTNINRLAVIGVSDWIVNEASKSYLQKATIMKRIYNWIDLDTFHPVDTADLKTKMGLDNKFVVLGVSSVWNREKGIYALYNFAKKLEHDKEVVLLLVGHIDNKEMSERMPNNIKYIEATNNVEQLVQYYSMSDLFVQLSKEESFGKVVAEALSCGTPVITIDSTANGELVNSSCGLVIQSENELVDAYLQIRENTKQYYSENCIRFAHSNFDMNKQVQTLVSVYQELIEKR